MGLFLVGAARRPAEGPPGKEPADIVEDLYRERALELQARVQAFGKKLESMPATRSGAQALRREVAALREAWKQVEFLTGHVHPGSFQRFNPPPLDRADMTSPDAVDIIPAEGLQVLLELAHEEDPWEERETLSWLALRLELAAEELVGKTSPFTQPPLDDRLIFEAMQSQVVRVMAAGITGFDAPAAERALPDSRVSLEAMRPVVALYLPELRRRDAALARRLERSLDKAIAMLRRGRDFDSFDRLAFLREAGNPLYAALIDAHLALDIATYADLAPQRRPVSVTARNLFDPGFLDPHFYSYTAGERPEAKISELGRLLFFDPILSTDGRKSCVTCHDPRKAFSDGLPKSFAFGGGTLLRNSPGLSYAGYQGPQFWDMRALTLEGQIQHVIHGDLEFRSSLLEVTDKLRAHPEYPALFRDAFGSGGTDGDPVNPGAMAKSLAMYIRSLGRWDSPFDRYVRGETEFLDPAARRGANLFMGKALCATCHFPPAFNGVIPPHYLETESEVLGVPERFPALPGTVLSLDPDPGRGHTHYAPIFRHSFKTPTVRNAELTGPYMHNGGMETLEDVMDFYNAGGGAGLGLNVPNQTLPSDSLRLTRREMDDVIAFMRSLTDTTGYGGMSGEGVGY